MAAKINVYQGDQIGGCITVISTDKTKIVIDFGENLPGADRKRDIEFDWEHEKVDAVFFTHYHGDHIGRFMEIPDDVDLYMGEVTFKVMLNIRRAIKDEEAAAKLEERFENGSITFVERAVPISINDDIVVTGLCILWKRMGPISFIQGISGIMATEGIQSRMEKTITQCWM